MARTVKPKPVVVAELSASTAVAPPSTPMLMRSLRVRNFRSIIDETFTFDALSVLIGKNNVGKTNVLRAIELLLTKKADLSERDFQDPKQPIILEAKFEHVDPWLSLLDDKNRPKIAALVRDGQLTVLRTADPETHELAKLSIKNPATGADGLPTGIEAAVTPMLPEPILVEAFIDPADEAENKSGTVTNKLVNHIFDAVRGDTEAELRAGLKRANALLNIVYTDEGVEEPDQRSSHLKVVEQAVTGHLESAFQGAKARIKIDLPEISTVLGKARVLLSDGGKWTDADLKGQGQQRALYVALLRTLADKAREANETGVVRPFLLMVEEPEAFLHPSAHIVLRSAFDSIAAKNQVVLTTHSPSMVSPYKAKEIMLLRKEVPGAKNQGTVCLERLDVSLEKKENQLRQLFEYPRSSKFLFASRALVVEGIPDSELFEAIYLATNKKTFDDVDMACVEVGGKMQVCPAMEVLNGLGLETYGVVDLDFIWRGCGSYVTDKGAYAQLSTKFWKDAKEQGLTKDGDDSSIKDGAERQKAYALLKSYGDELQNIRSDLKNVCRVWVLEEGDIETYVQISSSAKGMWSVAAQEIRSGAREVQFLDEIRSIFTWAGI